MIHSKILFEREREIELKNKAGRKSIRSWLTASSGNGQIRCPVTSRAHDGRVFALGMSGDARVKMPYSTARVFMRSMGSISKKVINRPIDPWRQENSTGVGPAYQLLGDAIMGTKTKIDCRVQVDRGFLELVAKSAATHRNIIPFLVHLPTTPSHVTTQHWCTIYTCLPVCAGHILLEPPAALCKSPSILPSMYYIQCRHKSAKLPLVSSSSCLASHHMLVSCKSPRTGVKGLAKFSR